MTYPFLFLVCSLACFRVTRLVTDDKIFAWLRRLPPPKSKAKELVRCPFCASAYFAAAITFYLWLYLQVIPGMDALLWWLSIWGGSVLLNQLFVRLSA